MFRLQLPEEANRGISGSTLTTGLLREIGMPIGGFDGSYSQPTPPA
jgi:hypothetical protein